VCGIFAILAPGDESPGLDDATFVSLRDRLRHRGPDDAGLWRDHHAIFGHRRLAIMDPARGHEPILRGDDHDPCIVVFNGELLNHLELRAELEASGERFETTCDAETAAAAVTRWGESAIDRFRGMFAVAWYRPRRRRLHLARDAFGVVPLLYAILRDGRIAIASEMTPLRELLGPDARIDPSMLSAYLASIRITVGDRTMLDRVRTVRPGHLVTVELANTPVRLESRRWWTRPEVIGDLRGAEADEALAVAISESVTAHLQSDVEVCTLLSGGLDSAVISTLVHDRLSTVRAFTAIGGDGEVDHDREAAALVAGELGIARIEVDPAVDADPLARWRRMIATLGVPLGTPNEIAIQALAEGVSRAGIKVALSGEGADELLGGYEPVLQVVTAIASASPSAEAAAATLVETIAWTPPSRQGAVLSSVWAAEVAGRSLLLEETSASIAAAGSPSDPRTYLNWLQDVNLTGLLGRLNQATMLSSVEARPPFADRRLAETVARISTEDLFRLDGDPADASRPRTKIALRRGFAGRLPEAILRRPKASFPTPFAAWTRRMLESSDVRDALKPLVDRLPELTPDRPDDILIAWPLANLGVWSVESGVPLVPG
jgi:asparagine synthase (glutamine-hydrolysing)